MDRAARAVVVSGGRVVMIAAAALAPCWRRERPGSATVRRGLAGVGVETWDGGIRGCVWIERGLRLMIWQAGVGGHRNGARCVGSRGSAGVVVVCRSGARPGVLIITIIGGHVDKAKWHCAVQATRDERRNGQPRQDKRWVAGWQGDVVLGLAATAWSGQRWGMKGGEVGKGGRVENGK